MDDLVRHVVPFLLVFCRLSGVMLAAPLLAGTVIPGKARVLLVVALAAAVYPTLLPTLRGSGMDTRTMTDVLTLGVAVASEVMLGFLVGLVAMLPVAAVQLSGAMMSLQIGFSLGSIVNPALETESEPLGELLTHVAIAAFLAMGGVEMVFLACANTFTHVPLAGFGPGLAPLELLTSTLGAGFDLALRVSLPLMGLILMETVAVAFVSKTMPQMNILSIGFAVKIFLGLGALVAGLRAIDHAIGEHVREVGRSVLEWSAAVGG